jgi:hypothetical protein
MILRPEIIKMVDDIQIYSRRLLHYPSHVGELLQIVLQTGLTNEFEDLIFQAKFLVQTQDVLNRVGSETEGSDKLSSEFQSGLKRASELLKVLVGRASADVVQMYANVFFAMDTESLSRLMKLYSDLRWIKNWQIDGKPLPYQSVSPKHEPDPLDAKACHDDIQTATSVSMIQRSAFLTIILMIIVLFIDPPVTILGWILSLGITALLAYIILQIHMVAKHSHTHRKDSA